MTSLPSSCIVNIPSPYPFSRKIILSDKLSFLILLTVILCCVYPASAKTAMLQWKPDLLYERGIASGARVSIAVPYRERLISVYLNKVMDTWFLSVCSQMLIDLSKRTIMTFGGPALVQVIVDGEWFEAFIRDVGDADDPCTSTGSGLIPSEELPRLTYGRTMVLKLSPVKYPDDPLLIEVPLIGVDAAMREAEELTTD